MKVLDQEHGEDWTLYQGDCTEVVRGVPNGSVDFTIFSPPFSTLFIYSDSDRDMGNSADDREFFQHFRFLIPELLRVTRPGRLCAVHCKQLVYYKGDRGSAGLRDFRGEIIREFVAAGWDYHSEVTIWCDPVTEMQRTKAHGLLHKQLCTDGSFSRQGLPDYLLLFRRWAKSEQEELQVRPVTSGNELVRFGRYVGTQGPVPDLSESDEARRARRYSIDVWQRYASPVWFDIDRMNVLNVEQAREDRDEKHLCPLQLDVIARSVHLWSNERDVVLSPFAGIGSEGYEAVKAGRRFLGAELKSSYFKQACANLRVAEKSKRQRSLFGAPEREEKTA